MGEHCQYDKGDAQDSRRLAAKDHHGLKTSNLTLVGPKSVMVFTTFYAHYPKRLPAQVKRQRKSSKWTNIAAKR